MRRWRSWLRWILLRRSPDCCLRRGSLPLSGRKTMGGMDVDDLCSGSVGTVH